MIVHRRLARFLVTGAIFAGVGVTIEACSSSTTSGGAPANGDASPTTESGGNPVDGPGPADGATGDTSPFPMDSSTSDTSPGTDAATLCATPITNGATPINDTDDRATPMPATSAAVGGTIESGTYFETQYHAYQGTTVYSATDTRKETFVFDATQSELQLVTLNNSGGGGYTAGTYSMSGSTLTLHLVCGTPATVALQYTYAAGTLSLYDFTKKTVEVYTKQ